jgi:pimeloyl-ACP methyl ester carboxylesterase
VAADLLDAARDAFTQGLQLAATLSAAVVIGAAVLTATLLQRVRTGPAPEPQMDADQAGADGALCCVDAITDHDALARAELAMNENPSGHTIELNGAALYYEERGHGAPLVLVHGGLASSAQWAPVASQLADEFRVITPDSRGHGRSTNPSRELSYSGIADDLAALIAALGLRRPVVGGWSDGGQIALELGACHPGTAGALIVGAAYPDISAGGLRDAHKTLLGADDAGVPDPERLDAQLGEFAESIKSSHPGGPEQWNTLVRQTAPMWLDYTGLGPHDLQAIQAPTLVLAGDRDELIALDLTVSLYRALPDAELAICPHADHAGPTPERARVFASLMGDFARRHTHT